MQEEFFEDDDFNDSEESTQNIIDFVKICIDRFFADKQLHCGGKIPKYMISGEKLVSMVASKTLLECVDIAYENLQDFDSKKVNLCGDVSPDVKIVNESLSVISKAGIPQQFAGGIMLMYLKFVKGIEIDV